MDFDFHWIPYYRTAFWSNFVSALNIKINITRPSIRLSLFQIFWVFKKDEHIGVVGLTPLMLPLLQQRDMESAQ